jgi:hypothetical protein
MGKNVNFLFSARFSISFIGIMKTIHMEVTTLLRVTFYKSAGCSFTPVFHSKESDNKKEEKQIYCGKDEVKCVSFIDDCQLITFRGDI